VTRWLLDSSVLIDATRARGAARDRAVGFLKDAARGGELWSVAPVRTEVRWAMRDDESALIDEWFASILWLDVTTELADRAGDHGQRWGRSHGLGVVDAIVAAAAEQLDARLATLNVRDFPMFPDLQPPY
jgi:predicted nucleic acid-binding protein